MNVLPGSPATQYQQPDNSIESLMYDMRQMAENRGLLVTHMDASLNEVFATPVGPQRTLTLTLELSTPGTWPLSLSSDQRITPKGYEKLKMQKKEKSPENRPTRYDLIKD